MASAEMVELWRGGMLESTHRGHAVICDDTGAVVAALFIVAWQLIAEEQP